MEVIRDAPAADSLIPLAVYQSQTPESFFSGPPVLHHHSSSATAQIQAKELLSAPTLQNLFSNGAEANLNGAAATNGHGEDEDDHVVETSSVDIWVTSERFILFNTTTSNGISITYPSISLHAIQRSTPTSPPSLFLQLQTDSSAFDDHDPDATISLTILPSAPPQITTPSAPVTTDGTFPAPEPEPEPQNPAQALYTALSDCADLHPDPATPGSDADDGGGPGFPNIAFEAGDADAPYVSLDNHGQQTALPPPMPGSGGWITAENMNEFFDEEGNWRGETGLGQGAGSVRRREDEDGLADGTAGRSAAENGDGNGDAEEEETKWRRTG